MNSADPGPSALPYGPEPAHPALSPNPDGKLPGHTGRRGRRFWCALAAGSVAIVLGIGGIALVRVTDGSPADVDVPAAAADVAAAVRAQPVTSVHVSFFDPQGMALDGRLTVTGDGMAAGTFADAVAGRAEFVAGDGVEAVRGDAAWWARRSPKQVSGLKDRWVEPDKHASPVDISVFGPAGLAGLVEHVRDGGAPTAETEPVDGQAVTGLERDGWTALFTRATPHTLVWVGGPMGRGSPVRPAVAADVAGGFRPAALSGPGIDRYAAEPFPVPTPPYLSISVSTPEENAEQKTRQLSLRVLPPISAAPADVATQAPPREAEMVPKAPAFEAKINARTCTGPTCSWSVTVTNTGEASGEAAVIMSVTPGMPPRTVSVGQLRPGQSRTTPVQSFANPAPRIPGRTTSVTGQFAADVYSPQVHGPDRAMVQRVRRKGLDPAGSTVLNGLDPAELASVIRALDVMSRSPEFSRSRVLRAAENAVQMGALPELRALVQSGRLENPEVLVEKLQNLTYEFDPDPDAEQPAKDQIGYRREIQIAADTLRRDPQARVTLDGVERVDRRDYTVDVLIKTVEKGAPKTIAVQAKSVSSRKVPGHLNTALRQLNGRSGVNLATGVAEAAPPGSVRVALLYLEPYSEVWHAADRAGLERRLSRVRNSILPDWCVDGTAQADEIVMVNQSGTHRWTKEQFNALLDGACA